MKAAVFGGGIAGLLATLRLLNSRSISEVILIENGPKLGGMLGSNKFGELQVDMGTHLLSPNGCKEVNQTLGLYPNKLMREIKAANGHAINGAVYKTISLETKGIFTDADKLIARQLIDISVKPNIADCSHGAKFGDLLNNNLFIPAISRFANVSRAEVSHLDDSIFVAAGLKRIRLSQKALNEDLKKNSLYCDALLATHNEPQESTILYPKTGGMGSFISNIEKKLLKSEKVKIKVGCGAKNFKIVGNKISSFSTTDGEKDISVDLALWSAPAQILGQILGEKLNTKPRFNEMCILHIRGKGKILSDLCYFYQHDGLGWRYTLYNNFRTDLPSDEILIGVEIVGGPPLRDAIADESLIRLISKELVDLNIVEPSFCVKDYNFRRILNGFPIIYRKNVKHMDRYTRALENRFANLSFVGRQAGSAFFMRDVLNETFKKVNNLMSMMGL